MLKRISLILVLIFSLAFSVGPYRYPDGSESWFYSTRTEGITISKNGYVGINTITPAYPLDVSGIARATSFIGNVSGNITTSNAIFSDSVTINNNLYVGATSTYIGLLTGTITSANKASNADLLDSQDGTYYTNASNLSSGTLPDDRLTGDYSITNLNVADTITVNSLDLSSVASDNQILFLNNTKVQGNSNFTYDTDYGEMSIKSTGVLKFGDDANSYIYQNGYYLKIVDDDSVNFETPLILINDGGKIGRLSGPIITFDDTNDQLEITNCDVGIGTATPQTELDVIGTISANSLQVNNIATINNLIATNLEHDLDGTGFTISANYFIGTLTGTANNTITANFSTTSNYTLTANALTSNDIIVTTANYLSSYPLTIVTNNYYTGISLNGNISANYFIGNGSLLTGISGSGTVTDNYYNAITLNNVSNVYYGDGSNLTGVSSTVSDNVITTNYTGNVTINGSISATSYIPISGQIIQVQTTTNATQLSSNSESWTEISSIWRITFTPKYANSKIILKAKLPVNTTTAEIYHFKFYDITNTTDIGVGPASGGRTACTVAYRGPALDANDAGTVFMDAVITNTTTTARTYGIYFKKESYGSAAIYFNYSVSTAGDFSWDAPMLFTITEIAQ